MLTGASLGCRSRKNPAAGASDVEHAADLLGVGLRLQAGGEDHHVHRDAPHDAGQRVFHADDQLVFLPGVQGPVRDLGHPAAHEVHALIQQLLINSSKPLPGVRISM